MNHKVLFLLLIGCFLSPAGFGQNGRVLVFPEIDQPCPSFTFHDVVNFSRSEASLVDFKGKWLVLDFWNKNCGACVQSFPKTSKMQQEFSGEVQFMMVAIQDKEDQIHEMYKRFREAEKLVMPCAFDSLLSKTWGIYDCPHIIIIGPDGMVKGVTNSLNASQVEAFLRGEKPLLSKTYHTQNFDDPRDQSRKSYDPKKPFMINGNGSACDTCFLFRSLLAKWDTEGAFYVAGVIDRNLYDSSFRGGRFEGLGVSLGYLYFIAYLGRAGWNAYDTLYGRFHNQPLFLLRDSSAIFQVQDNKLIEQHYCYSLTIPPARNTQERIMEIMRNDLNSYFGFKATIEERMFPYYRLVVTKSEERARLATSGGPSEGNDIIPRVRFIMHNMPFARLVPLLSGAVGALPVLNETGVTGNMDIAVTHTTYDELMRSLHEQGLDLIKSEKMMKCLVIRD